MSDEIFIQKLKQEHEATSTKSSVNSTTYPAENINLPSKGYFYDEKSPLSKGSIDMKMMTAKEEDILTNENYIKKGIVLDKLLESLIVTPGVNVADLLMVDKNALFIAARRLAYGDNYGPVKIECKRCNTENKITINLGEVQEKDVDFSSMERGVNEFEFIFPTSKRKITFKLLTSGDEENIDRDSKAISKVKKNASAEVTTRLKRMITSIDDKRDPASIAKFVDNELLSRDSMALRGYVKSIAPELDLGFNFACEQCQNEERMDVPMTVQFFWPDAGT
jgi:hypothetical protein